MDFYVIGDEHMVLGFGLVGIPGTIVNSGNEALKALKQVLDEQKKTKIVLISDRLTAPVEEEVEKLILKMDFPLVIEIPDRHGPREDKKSIRDLLKSSIGISV